MISVVFVNSSRFIICSPESRPFGFAVTILIILKNDYFDPFSHLQLRLVDCFVEYLSQVSDRLRSDILLKFGLRRDVKNSEIFKFQASLELKTLYCM